MRFDGSMIRVVFFVAVTVLVLGSPLIPSMEAASIGASTAAARSGNYGLHINLGSSCNPSARIELENQTISGPVTLYACERLAASSVTINSGHVVLEGGHQVVLGNGFQVSQGATLQVDVDGSYPRGGYVMDDTVDDEPHFATGFYLKGDAVQWGPDPRFEVLSMVSSEGIVWARLVLKLDPSLNENRLVIEARDDAGGEFSTAGVQESLLPPGWSWISLEFKSASASNSGHLLLYRDGQFMAELLDLQNLQARVDKVVLGAADVPRATAGSLDIDLYMSRLGGPIEVP